ncbi:hypothetical protein [Enterovirga sp.]|uniref:hypothetical protein n=1 Tax=Enterovirga sp. TaxID=2026350 RepID=UPI002B7BB65D|nr:hypothetical protein [Enterovirga sp.]HMO30411.1 hypothetical protein [Enterovirga sp.]
MNIHDVPAPPALAPFRDALLPSPCVVTGELRALCVYERPPIDCGAARVPDDAFAPHLKAGEMAVIDPEDRGPVAGELFLVKIMSPLEPDGIRLRLVQLRPKLLRMGTILPDGRAVPDAEDSVGWWMHFSLIRHHGRLSREEVIAELRAGRMSLCDGPLQPLDMRQKIVGRVVGVVLAGDA